MVMSFCSVFFNVKKNPSPLFIVTVNKRRPHGEKQFCCIPLRLSLAKISRANL